MENTTSLRFEIYSRVTALASNGSPAERECVSHPVPDARCCALTRGSNAIRGEDLILTNQSCLIEAVEMQS